ncbi:hypothetical protein MMC24_005271 [Lignoscripta atroalba]|nr:hypothetical protein [Lignoscripta atroalba]
MAEMCHYIVTGITLTSSNASSGLEENDGYALVFSPTLTSANVTELISYLAPSPPPKTGYHRYVFALLAPASDGGRKLKKPQDRPHWGYGKVGKGLRDWASENDLVTVGANFFYAQNKKQ